MSDHKFKRPAPLDRKKVAPQLVTSADAFSLMQYDERRRDTPALGELEANGRLPGMPAVLADLAFSLWAHEPGVKDEVPADRRYWRDLLGQTVDSSAFKSLSAQTRADWFMSTLGTIEASREILELVPDEDAQESPQALSRSSSRGWPSNTVTDCERQGAPSASSAERIIIFFIIWNLSLQDTPGRDTC